MTNKVAKIGINGFGRIGRIFCRCLLDSIKHGDNSVELVAINDPALDPPYIAYLLTHDTTHGTIDEPVSYEGNTIFVGKYMKFECFSSFKPEELPWGQKGVEIVIESTGRFTTVELASGHIKGGAKRVIISAPSSDAQMFVYGVNHEKFDPKTMQVISNASCTTNCLAPMAKVLNDNFTIVQGLMTTVHAMTATQLVVDGPSKKDWRGGRAASQNIIPSSTGAAKAVGKVLPALQGKLTGMAYRVPVVNVSTVDLTVLLSRPVTKKEIDDAMKAAEQGSFKGIIKYVDFDAVSSDFNSTKFSCIYDSSASLTFDGACGQTMFKLIAWYDNEMGYSSRLLDLLKYVHSKH